MFCKNCGSQTNGDTKFCNNCGADLQQGSQQTGNSSLEKNKPLIALVMAIIALVCGIITMFFYYDITLNLVKDGDVVKSQTGPLYDLNVNDMEPLLVGSILCGLLLVIAAIVGFVFFAKKGKAKGKDSKGLFVMSVIGSIGIIINILCFLTTEVERGSASLSASVPWFIWVIFVLFAGVAVLEKVVFNKKK